MFASVSSNGYLHVVSGSKLDPSQLRKAIKTAMLVDWYNAGIIEFEIRASKEMLWKSSTKLFIKLVKETELSDFEVERRFMMEMRLRENKEAQLYFRVPKPLFSGGREERRVLDILTNMMNLELVDMGYLKEVEGEYVPVRKKIDALKDEAMEIRRRMSEFKEKNPETYRIMQEAV